ncbi:A/G-specific adenine glycosylase [bacterium]|nr:A/G-specific adenine glycosylase [bacterium]
MSPSSTNRAKVPSQSQLVRRLLRWFVANARDLPWRRTLDPYAIWVSEIMLQQTQVKTVIPYFERWMKDLPDVASLSNVPSDRLHKLWEGLGYYTRARNLQKAAQAIRDQHGGKFPTDFDSVLALPGIGGYTAGAITSIAFNQPNPIVDGNVVRVLARLFTIGGDPKDKSAREQFWQLAEQLVRHAHRMKNVLQPADSALVLAGNCSALNQSLMELGATICTPANPQCDICPVKKLCLARATSRIGDFPEISKRAATTTRRFIAFVIRRGDKLLVRQRAEGSVNAHLWELPNAEIQVNEPEPVVTAATALQLKLNNVEPLGMVRHSITRYRITLECFTAIATVRIPKTTGVWIPTSELKNLAFTAAHLKLLKMANLQNDR